MARIFIVEDDRTIAELLQVALRHEGHEVWLDMTGDLSALDETFDLVLLDLTLPDADGLELARQIRAAYDLPLIMVTARGQVQDKVTGFLQSASASVRSFSILGSETPATFLEARTSSAGGEFHPGDSKKIGRHVEGALQRFGCPSDRSAQNEAYT